MHNTQQFGPLALDIRARRNRVPEAYAEGPTEEGQHPYIGPEEGEPYRIWDPQNSRVHPLDVLTWVAEPEESSDAETHRLIDGRLMENGTDLLAWYRSFHVDQTGWGIYIRELGIDYLSAGLGVRRELALRALWAHEYFHFLTDVAATFLEAANGKPIYLPYLGSDHRVWPGCRLSEALANAFSLAYVGRRHGKSLLRRFMSRQPPGYCDYGRYERRRSHDGLTRGYRELVAHLLDLPQPCTPSREGVESGELLVDEVGRSVVPAHVPIYFVPRRTPSAVPEVRFISMIPVIAESKQFLRDLSRLPVSARRQWQKTRDSLSESTRNTGTNLEKLRGHPNRFSVRLSRSIRAILEFDNGQWTAITVGAHEEAYRRAIR